MDTFFKRKHDDEHPDPSTQKTKFLRKYNVDFIKYGFVNGGTEAVPKAQCVECGLMLSNEALKPSKLQRHLETKHPMLVGKPVDYFIFNIGLFLKLLLKILTWFLKMFLSQPDLVQELSACSVSWYSMCYIHMFNKSLCDDPILSFHFILQGFCLLNSKWIWFIIEYKLNREWGQLNLYSVNI